MADDSIAATQPGNGAIVGVVTDAKLGDAAVEALVSIVGSKQGVLTEVDGSYRLEVPPGRYTLQIIDDLHRPVLIKDIVVSEGAEVHADAALEPDETVEESVDTVVQLDTAGVEATLLERKRAAAAGDGVGRAEITKANDKTAAEAARRVVGASIEGSRFLYVRGLGERYNNALLDGFPLPSPEPDRQAVPLDLFPSQILESLTIVKTFTPDVPGDFAGGSIRIGTRRIPTELTFAASLSIGFNTATSFADVLTYQGGDLDWLGFDDGTRALPDDLPSSKVVRGVEDENGQLITREAIGHYGTEMNSPMTARTTLGPPSFGGNVVFADSWALGDWGRIGVMAALVYDRRFERRADARLRNYGLGEGPDSIDGLRPLNDLTLERGIDRVSWGLLTGATLEIGKDHRLSLTGLYTRSADFEASRLAGRHEERAANLSETRLSYVGRSLFFGELQGSHRFPALDGLTLEYGIGLARAEREEPDSRGTTYQFDGTLGVYAFEDDSTSGSHFFSEQGETTVTGMLDVTQPIGGAESPIRLKAGGYFNLRDREFLARRFRFRPDRRGAPEGFDTCPGPTFAADCQDKLFTDGNIQNGFLELEENTRENDGYRAGLSVFAGYLMLDASVADKLRVVIGPRLEVSRQTITPFDPVNVDLPTEERAFSEVAILPALSVVYTPIPQLNLRAAVSRTIARPQLRELAPFAYVDYFGGREVRGNPDLVDTSIINADLRAEFFPSAAEVVAVSAFYKRFEDPIEQVIQASSGAAGVVSFANARGGNLFGVELEARKSFDVFHPVLRPLSLIANLTLTHSRVELDAEQAVQLTSQSRPLALSAPFVANVALDFDEPTWGTRARVSYSLVGPRLAQVGTRGIPDIYELTRHGLDVTLAQRVGDHVELRASATNLLDWPITRAHDTPSGEAVTEEYRTGQSFSLGVSVSD
ncbi:MAG: TonB-dependent receptor [Polyangiaceae bacterium]